MLNTILLFLFLFKFTKKHYFSAITACLFAIHPIHVESVAWISERKDVLSTLFFFLTLLSYHYYTKNQCAKTYTLLLLFFLLGVLSKPMLVTLPFILLLLDLWPLGRIRLDANIRSQATSLRNLLAEKIPFFIIISVLSVMAYITQKKGNAITSFDLYPLQMRLENIFVAYWVYLKKMIWPNDLAVHYPYPGQQSYWIIAASFIMFMIVCFYSLKIIKKQPAVIVGWTWFIITLFPVIGIVVIGPYLIADRYAYISFIGIYMIAAWTIDIFIQKYPPLKKIILTATICILLHFTFLSWHQVQYWKNSQTLFERAILVNKNNNVAHHNLATYFDHNKQYKKAIQHYEKAIQLTPNFTQAYLNLGNTYFKVHNYKRAMENFLKVTRLNPKHAIAQNSLGVTFRYLNDFDNSIKSFENALKIDPYYKSAQENLKLILLEKNKDQQRQ